ncbi:MAG: hypothetical protein KAJ19_27595 [Gammaproteobacteria bacterium]|nr:hypothetical protein [Gammaproteobacteria bacterium]
MKKPTLTSRQKQVLCLVTHPNRQIASILGISQRIVRRTLASIYKLFGLGYVSQRCKRIVAVTEALRLGLVTLGEISPGDRPIRNMEEEE